jgi:ATP-dependent HslUV protease subunit HslV
MQTTALLTTAGRGRFLSIRARESAGATRAVLESRSPGCGRAGRRQLDFSRTQTGEIIRGTTILAVRRDGLTAIGGDGQVSHGSTILKGRAVKIRKLDEGNVVAGFAGSVADALTLFDRFESKLKEHPDLRRAAVELAKDWRSDRFLRRLEAMLIAADPKTMLLLAGTGEVLEPDDDCCAVGSGGNYALAAARALLRHTQLPAGEIVRDALGVASELCIYTNGHITVEEVRS